MSERITDEERMARAAAIIGAEHANPQPGYYWLSFVDPGRGNFLGGCMVEAVGRIDAVRRSHQLGVNPGGEVAIIGPVPVDKMPAEYADRLLSAADVEMIEFPEDLLP